MPLLPIVNSATVLNNAAAPLLFAPMEKGDRKAKVTAENLQDAARLRELWQSRAHPSQAEFGDLYKIGNQSAVGQFLRGQVPLSLKAAKGFAKGLGVEIRDFSQRLADEATSLHDVAPAKKGPEVLSFLDLSKLEAQLIGMYRGLGLDHQNEVMQLANKLHSIDHPIPSKANPFAAVRPAGAEIAKPRNAPGGKTSKN